MKTLIAAFAILVILSLSLIGCHSCYEKPEVTGVADDGLWLYIDNYRYRSDMTNKEPLVTSIEIGGETYTDIEITDTEYTDSDTVFMCAQYGLESSQDNGTCFISYDIKEKTTKIIYDGGTEYEIAGIDYCNDKRGRFVLSLTENGESTHDRLIFDQGEFKYVLSNPGIRKAVFADSAIFTYEYNDIIRFGWNEAVLSLRNIMRISLADKTLYIETRNSYNDFTDGSGSFDFYGLYAYDTESGNSICLANEKELFDADVSPETDYYIVGSNSTHTINSKKVNFADHYALMYFNREKFMPEKIADLEYENAEWHLSTYSTTTRYLYLRADKQSDGYDDYKMWFDTQRKKFLRFRPDIPEYYSDYADSEDYYFYSSFKPTGLMSSDKWCSLHRVNKKTGKDVIMHVFITSSTNKDYNLSAVRNY